MKATAQVRWDWRQGDGAAEVGATAAAAAGGRRPGRPRKGQLRYGWIMRVDGAAEVGAAAAAAGGQAPKRAMRVLAWVRVDGAMVDGAG